MSSLTCKQFLQELNDYLDQTIDPESRARLQEHVDRCPNCFVVYDTCKKTIRVYRNCEPEELPQDLQARLMSALEKKIKAQQA